MLIFTFVIALGYFLFVIKALSVGATAAADGSITLKFPEIGTTALSLIGISGGTYLLAKGIQKAGATEAEPPKDRTTGTRVNTNP